jgi:hypothetical protein
MNDIKVTSSCPFGHTCEKHTIDDNGQIIETNRCKLYIKLAGNNPQTGELMDEWNCALSWSVIMLVENANTGRSVAAATESFRNEVVQGQNVFNQIALQAANNKLLNN